MSRLRDFLLARGYLEVETPILGPHPVPDLHIESVRAGAGFLHTSPEYAMKRLVAAGSGPIFQIVKAFRAEETGRRHSVEFTIAEWYRPGPAGGGCCARWTSCSATCSGPGPPGRAPTGTSSSPPSAPTPLAAPDDRLRTLAEAHGHPGPPESRAAALDFLFSTLVEPGLGRRSPTLVTRFPAPLAALARLTDDDPRTAERFEVFWAGLELANGYDELQDPEEHRRRFAAENRARLRAGRRPVPDRRTPARRPRRPGPAPLLRGGARGGPPGDGGARRFQPRRGHRLPRTPVRMNSRPNRVLPARYTRSVSLSPEDLP